MSQQLPGSVFLFDDRAIIWHRVPAGRSRFSYFRSRCYAEGLSKAQVTANVGTRDGLSTERRYATRTLPSGIVHGVTDMMHGDASGLERAGAITVGLCSTAAGYVAGSFRRTRKGAPADGERDAADVDRSIGVGHDHLGPRSGSDPHVPRDRAPARRQEADSPWTQIPLPNSCVHCMTVAFVR